MTIDYSNFTEYLQIFPKWIILMHISINAKVFVLTKFWITIFTTGCTKSSQLAFKVQNNKMQYKTTIVNSNLKENTQNFLTKYLKSNRLMNIIVKKLNARQWIFVIILVVYNNSTFINNIIHIIIYFNLNFLSQIRILRFQKNRVTILSFKIFCFLFNFGIPYVNLECLFWNI